MTQDNDSSDSKPSKPDRAPRRRAADAAGNNDKRDTTRRDDSGANTDRSQKPSAQSQRRKQSTPTTADKGASPEHKPAQDNAKPDQASKSAPAKPSGGSRSDSASSRQAGASASATSRAAQSATPERDSGGGSGAGADSARQRRRGGGSGATWLAMIAVVLAIVALALAAWSLVFGKQHVDQASQRIDQVQNAVNNKIDNTIEPRIETLKKHVAKRDQALDAIRQTLQTIQKRNARLAKQLEGSTRQWQLQRVESLLMAANRAVQLDRDPHTAAKALGLADQRLARMNDPSVFDLRHTITREQSKLESSPNPDITGIALKLGDAADHVDTLALATNVPTRFTKPKGSAGKKPAESGAAANNANATGGWWAHVVNATQRAATVTGQALSNMVTIRHSDSPPPAMLPPDRAAYLGENLALDLRSARLALLQGRPDLYKQNIKSARALLKQHFNTQSAQVASLQKRLARLVDVEMPTRMPDISNSLDQVRKMIDDNASHSSKSGNSGNSNNSNSTGKSGKSKSGSSASDNPGNTSGGSDS